MLFTWYNFPEGLKRSLPNKNDVFDILHSEVELQRIALIVHVGVVRVMNLHCAAASVCVCDLENDCNNV